MKIVKIRFTSWRDQSSERRSVALQKQLDALTNRELALQAATASVKADRAHADNGLRQELLARIATDLEKLEAERTFLISAEEAVAEVEARAAAEHEKVGALGYQVVSEEGTRVEKFVDEAGNALSAKAVYTYEVVDEDPPRPEWVKDGRSRH